VKEGTLKNLAIFDQIYKTEGQNYSAVYEPVLDLMGDLIEKYNYEAILDYGCGNGRFGYYFEKRNLKGRVLFGADISREGLKLCADFYDGAYVSDGLTLPDKNFDFIILNSVLEHIPLEDWDMLFSNITRRLTPAGGVFIIIPNKNSPSRRFSHRWDGEDQRLGHISLVDLSFVKKKLCAFGFADMQTSFIFKIRDLPGYFHPPKALTRVLLLCYALLNIFPMYYVRDSFWIFARRRSPYGPQS
jgi:SAM-dependent methyltransferase